MFSLFCLFFSFSPSVIRGLLARKHFNHMQSSKKMNIDNANFRQKSDRRMSYVKVLSTSIQEYL